MNPIISRNLSLFLFSILFLPFACKNEVKRFIDPEDKRYSEDIRVVSQRINKDPSNADLYYKRANTFFFEDKFKEALADIQIAIELNPEVAFYHFKQGEYYMSGDTADAKSAEKAYLKAIELDPEAEEVRIKYGILLLAKQRYNETIEQMNAVMSINPANPDALFFIGMAYKETGDTLRATLKFRETVEMNNTYYNAYMQLAYLFLDSDPQMALLYLDNALRIDEFSDEALYTKGLLMQNMEEYELAKEFYRRTKEINPGHRLAYYNLAYLDVLEENFPKALEQLGKLLVLDPEYIPALHFRGAIYQKLKMYENALKDFQLALKLEPENEEIKTDINTLKESLKTAK